MGLCSLMMIVLFMIHPKKQENSYYLQLVPCFFISFLYICSKIINLWLKIF